MIILRYSEIGLKGNNRYRFENRLISNLRDCLKRNNLDGKVMRKTGRILAFVEDEEKAALFLKNVFGVSSLSIAYEAELDISKIKSKAVELLKSKDFGTFRVSCQRTDKRVNMKSIDVEKIVGAEIVEKLGKKVSLKQHEMNVEIDLMEKAYLFFSRIEAFAGLPLGIEGSVIVLLSDESSLLAAWLMMKRGCKVILAGMKDIDYSLLEKYSYGQKLEFFKVKDLKEIDRLASKLDAKALVTGETLENFKNIDVDLMVLRPLIIYSDDEIKHRLKAL